MPKVAEKELLWIQNTRASEGTISKYFTLSPLSLMPYPQTGPFALFQYALVETKTYIPIWNLIVKFGGERERERELTSFF